MGIFVLAVWREAHAFHYLINGLFRFFLALVAMKAYDLRDLLTNPLKRVKGGHGILKYHRYLAAADLEHILFRQAQQVLTVENYFAVKHFAGTLGQQPHYAEGGGGFARARFADEAQCLTLLQGQAHMVYGLYHLVIRVVADRQILYFEEFIFGFHFMSSLLQPGIKRISQAVAQQIQRQDRYHDAKAGIYDLRRHSPYDLSAF